MRLIVSKNKDSFVVAENINEVTVNITFEDSISCLLNEDGKIEDATHEIQIDGKSMGKYDNKLDAKAELKSIMDYVLNYDSNNKVYYMK